MTNRWYRLGEQGTGTVDDPYHPDFAGHRADLDGWAGNKTHPDGAPHWVVRVYADATVLDAFEADLSGDAQRLPDVPISVLNQMFDQDRDAAGWERGFQVG